MFEHQLRILKREEKIKFIEQKCKRYKDNSRQKVYLRFKQISAHELEIHGQKDLSQFERDEFILFFKKFEFRKPNTFDALKSLVRAYLVFLQCEVSVLDKFDSILFEDIIEDNHFENSYFKSFDDLRYRIELHLKSSKRIPNPNKYATEIIALFFSWHGISGYEMVELKNTDITEDGVIVNGKLVQLHPDCMSFLLKYIDEDSLSSRVLERSDYILRGNRTKQLTYKTISSKISVFNKINDNQDKVQFTLSNVRECGIFWSLHEFERENGSILKFDFKTWKEKLRIEDIEDYSVKKKRNQYYNYVNYVYYDLYHGEYGK